jgi:hypothetical protein
VSSPLDIIGFVSLAVLWLFIAQYRQGHRGP